jgi:hypothetical protein
MMGRRPIDGDLVTRLLICYHEQLAPMESERNTHIRTLANPVEKSSRAALVFLSRGAGERKLNTVTPWFGHQRGAV